MAEDKTYDELLSEVPANARTFVAAAKNSRTRLHQYQELVYSESNAFKAHVRTLNVKYKLSGPKIAKLLEMSDTRVKQILNGKQ